MKPSSVKREQIEYCDFKNKDFLLDVVNRCQGGDTDAMEKVYIAYKSSLLNLAYRFTRDSSLAEDLLQDIFIKIFINIKKLRFPGAFNSWLYRIAVNTCMSYARKKGKTREVSLEEIENVGSSENSGNQVREQLEQAIKILPPKQKIVFQLHDVEGFTHAEIAKIMKSSEGTAKSQLFKARMKIRNFLRGT
ncbi:RNA polymerase sigma factor [Thermodesulfobacteriota bacterium]